MVNYVKAKTKYADGSLSEDAHYLFCEPDDRYGINNSICRITNKSTS